MWWNNDPGWRGWVVMAIGMGGLVALLRDGRPGGIPGPGARVILQQRFARGEIDAEDDQARLDTLTRATR